MKKENSAHLSCRICTTSFQKQLTRLTKPVDVYCEWIDECKEQERQKKANLGLVKKDKLAEEIEEDADYNAVEAQRRLDDDSDDDDF